MMRFLPLKEAGSEIRTPAAGLPLPSAHLFSPLPPLRAQMRESAGPAPRSRPAPPPSAPLGGFTWGGKGPWVSTTCAVGAVS